MKIRRWVIGICIGLVSLVGGCGNAPDPRPGHPAPSFELPRLDGGTVSLGDLLHKQPIIINAWASWCGPCQRETPELVSLANQYAGKVQVVGINMTSQDTVSEAKQFVAKYGIRYPILLDRDGRFLNDYLLTGFPTTFLIGSDGKVVSVYDKGELSSTELQSLFQKAAALNDGSGAA